jgi:hypothetical protein
MTLTWKKATGKIDQKLFTDPALERAKIERSLVVSAEDAGEMGMESYGLTVDALSVTFTIGYNVRDGLYVLHVAARGGNAIARSHADIAVLKDAAQRLADSLSINRSEEV